jgi:hypothetical protein
MWCRFWSQNGVRARRTRRVRICRRREVSLQANAVGGRRTCVAQSAYALDSALAALARERHMAMWEADGVSLTQDYPCAVALFRVLAAQLSVPTHD